MNNRYYVVLNHTQLSRVFNDKWTELIDGCYFNGYPIIDRKKDTDILFIKKLDSIRLGKAEDAANV